MNAPALPAYLQNRAAPALADQLIANLGMGSPPYVSIKGNRFTLVDGVGAEEAVETYDPKIGPYLDCCIVDANKVISRIYYDKPFDPSASSYEPPPCWSDNGLAPSRNAAVPQHADCGTCPKAVWGSAVSKVSGKGVPACSQVQKLAIVIPGDDVTFLMRVPPGSLGNLREYIYKFNGQNVDVSDVITRITFDTSGVGMLLFQATSYIDQDTYKRREALAAGKETEGLVGKLDQPRQAALPAPNVAQAQPITQTPAQPQQNVPGQQQAPAQPEGAQRRERRERRSSAQVQADAAANPAPAGAPLAPFPNGNASAGNFGVQGGAAPNAELESALKGVFG